MCHTSQNYRLSTGQSISTLDRNEYDPSLFQTFLVPGQEEVYCFLLMICVLCTVAKMLNTPAYSKGFKAYFPPSPHHLKFFKVPSKTVPKISWSLLTTPEFQEFPRTVLKVSRLPLHIPKVFKTILHTELKSSRPSHCPLTF